MSAQIKILLLTYAPICGKTQIGAQKVELMSKPDVTPVRARKERKQNADMRRQQLLDATLRSIVTNGLTKTTLATVAAEAGLSQGVAVFYFKSKTGLLTETLREQYERYEDNWKTTLANAGPDPLDQLIAVIKADFAPSVCNPEALSVWFAFWGEQKFTPQYAEISAKFDHSRAVAIRNICRELLGGDMAAQADGIADWIDTMTDGFWQKLHLSPNDVNRKDAIEKSLAFVAHLMPEQVARLCQKKTS
ncbi:MAG: TetR/AcrR family bet gene transcriptional repressor [Paracoccaceae bacterium]